MQKVIALLAEKNTYLEKFHYLNEQELLNLGIGNFDTIEPFYQARERILNLISGLDSVINEEQSGLPATISNAQRDDVADLLRGKDELVKSILAQDLQIMAYVEREKSNIIRELRATGTARRAVGAYANTERMNQMEEKS